MNTEAIRHLKRVVVQTAFYVDAPSDGTYLYIENVPGAVLGMPDDRRGPHPFFVLHVGTALQPPNDLGETSDPVGFEILGVSFGGVPRTVRVSWRHFKGLTRSDGMKVFFDGTTELSRPSAEPEDKPDLSNVIDFASRRARGPRKPAS